MKLTDQDVEHIAGLARLRFTEKERSLLAAELCSIFHFFQSLQAVDTAGVETPGNHALCDEAVRFDEALPCLPREEVFRNAPEREKGFFKVPNIIER